MSEAPDIYVLDTSAWLTLIEDAAGADCIEALLDKARAGESLVLVSFMSFMEVDYLCKEMQSTPNGPEGTPLEPMQRRRAVA